MNTEALVYFADDTQLMGYGESDSSGAWIKLQILPEQLEKFRGLKGTVFHAVFVRQDDQGQPVVHEQKPAEDKGGPLAKLAGMWCREPTFWAWLTIAGHQCANEEEARAVICSRCGIASRAQLDHNGEAKRIFEERFRRPYANYLQRMGR